MIFFIEYDRTQGELISMKEFDENQREEAHAYRFKIELERFQQGIEQREIVLLEAVSRHVLLNTHGRYFKTLRELLEQLAKQVSVSFSQ